MIIIMTPKRNLIDNLDQGNLRVTCTDKLCHIVVKGKRVNNSFYFRISESRFRCIEVFDCNDILNKSLEIKVGKFYDVDQLKSVIEDIKYLLTTGFY